MEREGLIQEREKFKSTLVEVKNTNRDLMVKIETLKEQIEFDK